MKTDQKIHNLKKEEIKLIKARILRKATVLAVLIVLITINLGIILTSLFNNS